jgi:hypothetical protein
MSPIYTTEDALMTVPAVVRLRNGGIQTIICSYLDFWKIDGMLVHPFLDNRWDWRLFVLEDPKGNRTDYERKSTGELTDGKSFHHYISPQYKQKLHFRNNEWTDLTRGNWETYREANQGSPAERRLRPRLRNAA